MNKNKNYDIIKIAKEALKDKSLIFETLKDNKVKIFYKGPNVTTLKPCILLNTIKLDKQLGELIGLYLGDGNFLSKDNRHTIYTSIDKDIIEAVIHHFISVFGLTKGSMHIYGSYSQGDKDIIIKKWSKELNFPIQQIKFRKRNGKNRKEAIELHITSPIFREIFHKIIKSSLDEIKKDTSLRRAFLRGFFAADGGIETRKNKSFRQISHIIFAYHKTKEIWLRDFIIECMSLEGISKFTVRRLKGKETACIRITLWEYIVKFWEMNLFDLCQRKKNVFLNAIEGSIFYLQLNDDFHKNFFKALDKTQEQIAKIIKCNSLGETCDIIHGKHLLNLKRIKFLLEHNGLEWRDVIKSSNAIRIGQRGYLPTNSNFLEFVLNKKRLI